MKNQEELITQQTEDKVDTFENEMQLISAMIAQSSLISVAASRLVSSDFFNPILRACFISILEIYQQNTTIVSISLLKQMVQTTEFAVSSEEYNYIFEKIQFEALPISAEEFVNLVNIQKCASIQHSLLEFSNTLSEVKLTTSLIENQLNDLNTKFFDITSSWITNIDGKDMNTLSNYFQSELNKKKFNPFNSDEAKKFNDYNYNWCLRSVNELLDGFNNDQLYILAARPGIGKSTLALNWAVALSKIAYEKNQELRTSSDKKHIVLFFSLEMSAEQFYDKMASLVTQIPYKNFKHKNLNAADQTRYNFALHSTHLNELPIIFFDSGDLNLSKIEALVKDYSTKNIIDLVVIDYLQLIRLSDIRNNMNRANEVATISKALKTMALSLHISILALSQLSRRVDASGSNDIKKPLLSDLRESGSIEQDADVVMFLYYSDDMAKQEIGNEDTKTYQITFAVEKNRFGSLGLRQMQFSKYCSRFDDDFINTDMTNNETK